MAETTQPPKLKDIEQARQELFELHKKLSSRGLEIMRAKNHDYSKGHPLGNFMVAESLQVCSAEDGIIVRISDKLSRLASILKKGTKVKDESVEDTIVDAINYLVLLAAVIEYKKAPISFSDIQATDQH